MTKEISIDSEFQALIPLLADAEREGLERSLLAEGCRDPLVVWKSKGILLDGHNRYDICQKHGIEFNTHYIDPANRIDAKVWIVRNQLERRNLKLYQRCELVEHLEDIVRAQAKEKQRQGGEEKVLQKSVEPVNTQKEMAKMAGVSHDTWAKFKKISDAASAEQKEELRLGESSINRMHKDLTKTATRKKRKAEIKKKAQSAPAGVYSVIYADPPWSYDNQIDKWGAADQHYETMELNDICGYLDTINVKADDNAVLFLWATAPFAQDAFKVVEAWDFQYKTQMVWVKTELKKPGSGFYVRGRHELLYICTRGSFTPLDQNISPPIGSVIEAPVQEHSRKPDEAYEIIEKLYPGCNYIELFARRKRDKWASLEENN